MKKIIIIVYLMLMASMTFETPLDYDINQGVSYQTLSTAPQRIDIDTEKLNTQFSFYGSATYLTEDKSFRIVNNAASQSGTVYFNDRLSLDYDFEINMEISMFNKTGTVADGVSIGFTQSEIGTIGLKGHGMGVLNTINSTALVIDSYRNTNDPQTPALAVRYTGRTADSTFRNASGTAVAVTTPSVANGTVLKDATNFRGQIVPITVSYKASTKINFIYFIRY